VCNLFSLRAISGIHICLLDKIQVKFVNSKPKIKPSRAGCGPSSDWQIGKRITLLKKTYQNQFTFLEITSNPQTSDYIFLFLHTSLTSSLSLPLCIPLSLPLSSSLSLSLPPFLYPSLSLCSSLCPSLPPLSLSFMLSLASLISCSTHQSTRGAI